MTEPEDPRLRLDGVDLLGSTALGAPALGRDPFETEPARDPLQEALAELAPPRPRLERRPSPRDPVGVEPRGVLERWMGPDVLARLASLEAEARHAEGAGRLSPGALRLAMPPFLALYRGWFRVESEGHEHLPASGPALLVANHAGLLPFDGAMLVLDVLLKSQPPRLPRAVFDRFVERLAPVRRLFEAAGAVRASRDQLAALLRARHLALVFPEGIEGIVKPLSQRYRLQRFHTGFVRQALQQRVPIVPVVIAGSDDQAPLLYDVKPIARALGLPVAPITPTFPWLGPLGLLPLPVRYRIVYGEPIDISDHGDHEAAADDALVGELAQDVRRRMQRLLDSHRG